MNLAYILLAHQHPDLVVRLIKRLISQGSTVVLHYDLNAGEDDFKKIQKDLTGFEQQVQYADRIKVGWGEWSIIQATLSALEKLSTFAVYPDYVHLASGADYPIRSENEFKSFLLENKGMEFIQAVDITKRKWVTAGLDKERYQYRHFFNWQKNKKLFDWNFKIQKLLKKKRDFPSDFTPHMGSQWWTLTGNTCQGIVKLSKDKKLINFFKTVWIPDEMYIQTLVAKLVEPAVITNKCLTLYQFTHNGLPLVFTNSHFSYLSKQPFFFARKISPFAERLRDKLDEPNTENKPVKRIAYTHAGIVSDEYNNFYNQSGNKYQSGKRIIGFVEDAWYGDLKWNHKNYFVITGGSSTELKLLNDAISHLPDVICHGELFNPKKIDFADKVDTYNGFNCKNILLRDNSKVNFLCQIIKTADKKIPFFILPYGQADDILEVCIWDHNAKIIDIKSSPLMIYRENNSLALNKDDKEKYELFQNNFLLICNNFNDLSHKIESKIKNSKTEHLELCLYDTERNFGFELLNFLDNTTNIKDLKNNIKYQLYFTKSKATYMKLHLLPKKRQKTILSNISNAKNKKLSKLFKDVNTIGEKKYINKSKYIPTIVVIGASKEGLLYVQSCIDKIKYPHFYLSMPKNDHIDQNDIPSDSKVIKVSFLQYTQKNHIDQALKEDNVLFVFIRGDRDQAYHEMQLQDRDNQDLDNYLMTSFNNEINYFEKQIYNVVNTNINTLLKIDLRKGLKMCQLELTEFFNLHHL